MGGRSLRGTWAAPIILACVVMVVLTGIVAVRFLSHTDSARIPVAAGVSDRHRCRRAVTGSTFAVVPSELPAFAAYAAGAEQVTWTSPDGFVEVKLPFAPSVETRRPSPWVYTEARVVEGMNTIRVMEVTYPEGALPLDLESRMTFARDFRANALGDDATEEVAASGSLPTGEFYVDLVGFDVTNPRASTSTRIVFAGRRVTALATSSTFNQSAVNYMLIHSLVLHGDGNS